jgi:hypothetical protein
MDRYKNSQVGVIVECEDGYVFSSSSDYGVAQAFDNDGHQIERWQGNRDHFQNFLAAVRSGKREELNADVQVGHVSAALCHTANISHRLGEKRTASEIQAAVVGHDSLAEFTDRMLAHLRANEVDVDQPVVTLGPWLEFDPHSERFTNNSAANHFVRREDRKPFVVPTIT